MSSKYWPSFYPGGMDFEQFKMSVPPLKKPREKDIFLPPQPRQVPQPQPSLDTELDLEDIDRPMRESSPDDIQPIPGAKGAPRYWTVTNPITGDKYNWLKDTPPTQEEADQFIYDKVHRSTWGKLTDPLSEKPSILARKLTAGKKVDERMPFGKLANKLGEWAQPEGDDTSVPLRGAMEAGGDFASSMTSPWSMGSTAASLGTLTTTAAGLKMAPHVFNRIEQGLGGVQALHGAYGMYEGAREGDMGRVGASALETGFGALGLMSKVPKQPPPLAEFGQWGRPVRGLLDEGAIDSSTVKGIGTGQKLLPAVGETYEPPPPPGLPPSRFGGGPPDPPTGPYYAGRRGVGSDAYQAGEPYVNPASPEERAFNAQIPNRYKPSPVENASPPFEYVPPLAEEHLGTGRLPDLDADIPTKRGGAVKNATTGLSHLDDAELARRSALGDKIADAEIKLRAKNPKPPEISPKGLAPEAPEPTLEDIGAPKGSSAKLGKAFEKAEKISKAKDENIMFMAELGDKQALREAYRRGLIKRQGFMSETGAVGKGTGDVARRQREIKELRAQLKRAEREGDFMMEDTIRDKIKSLGTKAEPVIDENPIAAKFRASLNEAEDYDSTRFILPDGKKLTHNSHIHEDAANELGVKLSTALDNGIIRFTGDGGEISSKITHAQAETLADAAYYTPDGKIYLDVRGTAARDSKAFARGTTPDQIRNYVNTLFADVPQAPLSSRDMLKRWGFSDEALGRMSQTQIDDYARDIMVRDTNPTFTEHQGLLDRMKQWKILKDEGGFVGKRPPDDFAEQRARFKEGGRLGSKISPFEKRGQLEDLGPLKGEYQEIANRDNVIMGGVRPERGVPVTHKPGTGGFQHHVRGGENWVTHPMLDKPQGPFATAEEAFEWTLDFQETPEFRRRLSPGAPDYLPPASESIPFKPKGQMADEAEDAFRNREVIPPRAVEEGRFDAETPLSDRLKRTLTDESGFWKPGAGKSKTPKQKRQGFINPAKGTQYEETFSKWVNKKAAARVEAVLEAGKFKNLKDLGKEGVKSYARGSRTGQLRDVDDFIRNKNAQMAAAKVSAKGERHLAEIFDNTPEEIDKVYKKLGRKTAYNMETMFDDIKLGTEKGLTPKFQSIPHMIEWYGEKADRMILNKQYREIFKQKGWVKLKGQGDGSDWRDIPNTLFPPANIQGKSRHWVASPEFATLLENHLGEGSKFSKFAGDFSSTSKNLALSAGFPKTAVNAHGANIFARSTMVNLLSNPKRLATHGKYILRPSTALADLKSMQGTMKQAVEDGLTLTTEGYSFGEKGGSAQLIHDMLGTKKGGMIDKAMNFTGEMFEDPLFQKVIPAIKLKHYNDLVGDFMKEGMSRASAGKQAAAFTNEVYGGINWQAMGRSKDMQNWGRAAILAPDWLETNLRLGKGSLSALKNPTSKEGAQYRKMMASATAAYAAANIANYMATGHTMLENPAGHTLDVYAGTKANGKTRWYRPFGTAADFARLPFDVASAAMGIGGGGHDFGQASEIVGNRASIPGAAIQHFVTKRDRFGRPILGQDDYGRPLTAGDQITNLGLEASSLVTPPYVKGGVDWLRGKIDLEEAAIGGGELFPLRYSSAPKPKSGGRSRPSRPSR